MISSKVINRREPTTIVLIAIVAILSQSFDGSMAQVHNQLNPVTIQSGSSATIGPNGIQTGRDLRQNKPLNPAQLPLTGQLSGVVPQLSNGGTVSLNNHISNIKLGNTKKVDINNVNQHIAPNVKDSVYNAPTGDRETPFGSSQNHYPESKPHSHLLGPTMEQVMIKEKLLELLDKATGENPTEAEANKNKLGEALRLLNPNKLPADLLRGLLDDAADGHIDDTNYLDLLHDLPPEDFIAPEPPAPEPVPEPLPELEELPPEVSVPEFEMEAPLAKVEEKSLFEQVRDELDDRLRRITDLLYFRPEYMNQLLQINECTDLTPLEAEFKRMILCNSDEQFCNRPACPEPLMAPADELEPAPVVASALEAPFVRSPAPLAPPFGRRPRTELNHFKADELDHELDGAPIVRAANINSNNNMLRNNNGLPQQRYAPQALQQQQQRLGSRANLAGEPSLAGFGRHQPPASGGAALTPGSQVRFGASPSILAGHTSPSVMQPPPSPMSTIPMQQPQQAASSNNGLVLRSGSLQQAQLQQQQQPQQPMQVAGGQYMRQPQPQAQQLAASRNVAAPLTSGPMVRQTYPQANGFELRRNSNFAMPSKQQQQQQPAPSQTLGSSG